VTFIFPFVPDGFNFYEHVRQRMIDDDVRFPSFFNRLFLLKQVAATIFPALADGEPSLLQNASFNAYCKINRSQF
jgi:hypothetical protein